jgi:hypothetical protein
LYCSSCYNIQLPSSSSLYNIGHLSQQDHDWLLIFRNKQANNCKQNWYWTKKWRGCLLLKDSLKFCSSGVHTAFMGNELRNNLRAHGERHVTAQTDAQPNMLRKTI